MRGLQTKISKKAKEKHKATTAKQQQSKKDIITKRQEIQE